MQKYQSIISGTNGSVIRNVPVTVLKEDGSLAEIFLDREGQVPAPNPLATDSRGVFYFYAKNGRYSLRTAADGVQITDADTVLLFDPDETVIDGPIAGAVRRAEDAAERAETALGDSGLQNLVQDAQDAAANAAQAVIDANQATASIDAALIEAGEAKDAAQAAAQTASNAASGAQAVKDSLLTYSGALSATPEWTSVPAHEDPDLDAQTQAALNRIEKLKGDQQLLKQRADKSVLSYTDYAAASAAAATLPDGQVLISEADEVNLVVQSGAIAQEQSSYKVADYTKIRGYTGRGSRLRVLDHTGAHWWVRKGSAADNGGTILVDGLARSWEREYSGPVNVKWFGAKGDGSTDDTAAIAAARNFIAATLAAGNRHKLVFPPGRYMYSESPNWAINRLDLEFIGEVWLINTGNGVSFLLDGGETGPGVLGLKIKGYPLVYGGASTTNGYFLRAVHRSDLELNCRGAGSAFAGLFMAWCVSNTVKFIMNFNEGGLYNTPARGMFLTSRNANEETSYNTFINPECSGMPVGIYEDASLGNLFIGGAVQACTNVGLQQTSNCWNSKFIGTDFEVNTNGDVECNARESQFIGVDMEKKITFQSAAVNCSVIGGAIQDIIVNSGATRTLLSGVTYNRFGGGNITDNGTQTRYRDVRDKFSGIVSNTPRAKTTVSVGASPFTYTNTTGNEIDLIIAGGTVSQLIYTRFAGDVISPPQGMFRLSPGDSMTMTYSVAPTVLEYTR